MSTPKVRLFLTGLLLLLPVALAQETAPDKKAPDLGKELEQLRREMEEQRKAFDGRLQEMQQKLEAVSKPAGAATAPQAADLQKEIDALRRQMQAQHRAFEDKLQQFEKKAASVARVAAPEAKPPAAPATPAPAPDEGLDAALAAARRTNAPEEPTPSFFDRTQRAFQSMNPDISVIGDFLAHYDSRQDEPDFANQFLLREVEFAFSGDIDPYARAFVFVAVAEDPRTHEFGVDLEEGYLTLLTLPWGLQAKAGRFQANFGKVNALHLHALPWVEEPLAIRRFFGEEGLSGDGVSVSWLIPNPWDHYIELTGEVFNNNNEEMFAGEESRDVVELAHLRDVLTLSAASTLEFGLSGATGPNTRRHSRNRSWVEGADVTYKWRPLREGLYRSFMFQTEVFAAQKDVDESWENSWGLFSAAEYQLSRRWFLGARYDFSQLPDDPSLHEHAGSAYLTFRQSEFCYWRLAYQHSARNFAEFGEKHDDQVWLQLNFSLGAHGKHKY